MGNPRNRTWKTRTDSQPFRSTDQQKRGDNSIQIRSDQMSGQRRTFGRRSRPNSVALKNKKARVQTGPCPWRDHLKNLSPLTNQAQTAHNFGGQAYRSDEWLERSKSRTSLLPVQSHDAHYVADSHFLRSFNEAPNQPRLPRGQGWWSGTHKKEKHWGLVASMPNSIMKDSSLVKDGGDPSGVHIGHSLDVPGFATSVRRGKGVPIGRVTVPAMQFTESIQVQGKVKRSKIGDL